jgi:Protein of unknown function (DUF1353)
MIRFLPLYTSLSALFFFAVSTAHGQMTRTGDGLKGIDWDEIEVTIETRYRTAFIGVSNGNGFGLLRPDAKRTRAVMFVNGVQVANVDSSGGEAEARHDVIEKGLYKIRLQCSSEESAGQLCALASFPLVGSAPPDNVQQLADAKNKHWVLMKDMDYKIGDTGVKITVPAGFVHDYASVPRIFHSVGLSPHDSFSRAAIIHDWLFWSQGCRPDQANRLMVLAMKESGVPRLKIELIYRALALVGRFAWHDNAGEYKSGLPRIIPAQQREIPPNVLWDDYRKTLANAGVRDPVFPKNPAYCAYGDSEEVPRVSAITGTTPKPSTELVKIHR